jgi:hypothetical protein
MRSVCLPRHPAVAYLLLVRRQAHYMMKRHLATLLFVVILPMAQFAFAGEDEGIAVVGRYIADTKHWKPIEYKIEKQWVAPFTWFASLQTRSNLTPAAANPSKRIMI